MNHSDVVDPDKDESRTDQWRNYMQSKKAKLQQQINVDDKQIAVSEIFKGISIFVNGYTEPPASELRRLVQLHGGEYHLYYKHGGTTYTIATHVAAGKAKKLRKEEKIVHPKWITDCLRANKRLPVRNYLLYEEGAETSAPKPANFFARRDEQKQERNAATDPNFVNTFYERSRLHLISTLAQEMKQYVKQLREDESMDFSSRIRLQNFANENFVSPPEETICHVDLDCFFVSVAQRTRKEIIGKPVAITHSKGTDYGTGTSEIASCNYEARAYGVRNGIFIREAKKMCPDLICLPYQFDDYREVSKQIYTIISRYTVDIRAVSCDEFYVDLRSLCLEMKITAVMNVVSVIRDEIRNETGCSVSVGAGCSMLIARMATRRAKPNGQYLVKRSEMSDFIKCEKIINLPGVGYHIIDKLTSAFGEMNTCEELQRIPLDQLRRILGFKLGNQVYDMCRGSDKEREFLEKIDRKSVSCNINYGIRFKHDSELDEFFGKVCAELENRLIALQYSASAVTLRLLIRKPGSPLNPEKYLGCGQCDAVTRTAHLTDATTQGSVIHAKVKTLFKAISPVISDLRGIGVQLTRLSDISNARSQKSSKRNTLTQFFSVTNKVEQRKRKRVEDEEDRDLQIALALSREEYERAQALKCYYRPLFRCCVTDLETKAEMLRILQTNEPSFEEVVELTQYFCQLAESADFADIFSKFKFLEREALNVSHEWLVATEAIKQKITKICEDLYMFRLQM